MISQHTLLKYTNFSIIKLEFNDKDLPSNEETEHLRNYIKQVILQNYNDMTKIGPILERASDVLEKEIGDKTSSSDNLSKVILNLTNKDLSVENEKLFKRAIDGLIYQENPLNALYKASLVLHDLSIRFTKG